jgi:adenosylcobyric acid synthase
MSARTLMVQGTASSVGKSLIVAALCRIFRNRGLRVAPFKSQNMALNSFVTPDGGEIGRAQAVQAEAARIAPAVEMNPILLKPEGGMRSQVVVMGRPIGSMTFAEYHERKPELCQVIDGALDRLRADYDLIIIEGAGSPAEINLYSHDIVNMYVAETADAPVILIGDIDRGGVFAHLAGTIDLLQPRHRGRVAAFLINKFRGDRALLKPGLDFLTERFGIPVIGVIPHIPNLRIAEEDSVALEDRRGRTAAGAQIDIAAIRLPHLSNYDDFLTLEHEADVVVRFAETPEELAGADLIVIPGSKSTVADLAWMRRVGIADAIVARASRREPIVGICGGCQMLGEAIEDPDAIESPIRHARGLGLLPLRTRFANMKTTAQVRARLRTPSLLSGGESIDADLVAYEIHMGLVEPTRADARAAFTIAQRNGVSAQVADGGVSGDGAIVGTMLHGIFDNEAVRAALMRGLARRKGIGAPATSVHSRDAEYDRLANVVAENIDLPLLARIAGVAPL